MDYDEFHPTPAEVAELEEIANVDLPRMCGLITMPPGWGSDLPKDWVKSWIKTGPRPKPVAELVVQPMFRGLIHIPRLVEIVFRPELPHALIAEKDTADE